MLRAIWLTEEKTLARRQFTSHVWQKGQAHFRPLSTLLARLTFIMLLAASSGCVGLIEPFLGDSKPTFDELKEADRTGNIPFLEQACANAKDHASEACVRLTVIRAEQSTDCPLVSKTAREMPKKCSDRNWATDMWYDEFGVRMGKKLASCGDFAFIFEELAGWAIREHPGTEGLVGALDEQGVALSDGWFAYLASNGGAKLLPGRDGADAMQVITRWLAKKQLAPRCAEFARGLTGAALGPTGYGLTGYLVPNRCVEGRELAVQLLTSENAWGREQGCTALGALGDASVLPKLNIVASSDATKKVEERRTDSGRVYGLEVFPVREACQAAIGKIRLRGAK